MAIPANPQTHPLTALSESGDLWVVTKFASTEGVDQLFEHKAEIVAKKLDQKTVLGQSVSFTYQPGTAMERHKERFYHGFCASIKLKTKLDKLNDEEYFRYELCVVPWSWFLTLSINCRVYQSKKTEEIISSLVGEHGFHSKLEINTSSDQQQEYCVQFNENDWAFIQRLIQSQGWFFYFSQEEGDHKLVIIDSNQRFKACGEKNIKYFGGHHRLSRTITEWEHDYHAQAGSVVSGDYNYELAQPVLSDQIQTQFSHAQSKHMQQFIYPGGFDSREQGQTLSSHWMKGIDAGTSEVSGAGNLYHFASGTTFELSHHPISSEQGNWLLSEVVHEVLAVEGDQSMEYKNQFCCTSADVPWKTQQLIAKPIISGMQSAVVTGPDNEEICLDKHHRIKLQFHWDREGKNDQTSSCWVRVAQPMAGDGFGSQFTPRVGDEVLVCFLNGDPDCPLVVGAAYNGKHQQPYTNSMEQGLKLKSLPGAGADNFSEVRFNCKKGQELLSLQAEKDMSVLVKNDSDRKVTGNDTIAIEKSSERTVKENDTHKIQGEQVNEVSKKISITTDADYQLQAKGKVRQHSDTDYQLTTKQNASLESEGDMNFDAKSSMTLKASREQMLEASTVSAKGSEEIKLTVGGTKIVISQSSAEISCGESTIKLSPEGVEISGMQVKIEGQQLAQVKGNASASFESGGKLTVQGMFVTVKGKAIAKVVAGGLASLSGSIVKIN